MRSLGLLLVILGIYGFIFVVVRKMKHGDGGVVYFAILGAAMAETMLVLKWFGHSIHRVGGGPDWILSLTCIYLLGLNIFFFVTMSEAPLWLRLLGSVLWPLVALVSGCLIEYQRYKKMGWGFLWREDGSVPASKKKYDGWKITLVTLALIGAMALLLVFQQGESIRLLTIEVSMLRSQVDRLQNDSNTVKNETRRLAEHQELDQSTIEALLEGELKKSQAYCKMFPQAKNCKDILAMFAGQDTAK
jgi:hypothetical protein